MTENNHQVEILIVIFCCAFARTNHHAEAARLPGAPLFTFPGKGWVALPTLTPETVREHLADRPHLHSAHLRNEKVSDQRHSEREGESVGEALDSSDFLALTPQQQANGRHRQTGHEWTDHHADSVKPRWTHEGMWNDENTQS